MSTNEKDGSEPPRITLRHLLRLALVYLRQSSYEQVKKNTGSQIHQRNQADVAKQLGWPDDRIRVLDQDLGLTGTSAGHRPGWKMMLELIASGSVGAVFVVDISRLSRNLADLLQLVNLCIKHDVILVVGGRVVDPKDSNDLFLSKIFGAVMEFENHLRMTRMREGARAKARQGTLVKPLPVGWVKNADKTYDFDPEVSDIIQLVIKTFWETRSLLGTVRALDNKGTQLPARRQRGRIVWTRPNIHVVKSYLTNAAYAGTFLFGKTRSVPELGRSPKGQARRRAAPKSDWIEIPGHHPAYLTVAEQEKIKLILKDNAFPRRDRPGRGEALLQGFLTCGGCGKRLTVKYR